MPYQLSIHSLSKCDKASPSNANAAVCLNSSIVSGADRVKLARSVRSPEKLNSAATTKAFLADAKIEQGCLKT